MSDKKIQLNITGERLSYAAPRKMSDKKILVVDDNEVIVKTLSLKLQGAGYKVLSAADPSTAIKVVRSENPDLLILDINFPADVAAGGSVAWDGFVILQWLARLNEDWRKPVIIITGEQSPDYEAHAKAAGAVAFFRKPVDNQELLKVVRQVLGEDKPASAPPSA
jgi:CheY-like chemotaxis protein